MATVTKASLESSVASLMGSASATVDAPTCQNAMDDVVRKAILYSPDLLKELESDKSIAATTTALTYVLPTLKVFRNGIEAIPVSKTQHIKNTYSMLNDLGNTQYYTIVGSNLVLEPEYDSDYDYVYRDIDYSATVGNPTNITWSQRLLYPLSLYIAMMKLLDNINDEIDDSVALTNGIDLDGITEEFLKSLDVLEADFTFPEMGDLFEASGAGDGTLPTFTTSLAPTAPEPITDTLATSLVEVSGTQSIPALTAITNAINAIPPLLDTIRPPAELATFTGTLTGVTLPTIDIANDADYTAILAGIGTVPTVSQTPAIPSVAAPAMIDVAGYDPSYVSRLFTKANARLAADDVELANTEIENIKAYLSERGQKAQEHSVNVQNYLAQFEAYKTKYDAYATEVSGYAAGLRANELKLNKFQSKIQTWGAQIQSASTTIAAYEADVQAHVAKAGTLNANVQRYLAELSGWRSSLELIGTQIQAHAAAISAYQAQLQAYSARVDGYQANVQNYSAKVGAYATQVQHYSAQVSKYSQDIEAYSASLNKASVIINKYSAELQGVSARVGVFSAEVERYNTIGQLLIGKDNSLANKLQSRVHFITSMFGRVTELNKRYVEFFSASQSGGEDEGR